MHRNKCPHRWLLTLMLLSLIFVAFIMPAYATDWDGLIDTIQAGVEAKETVIDISSFRITEADFTARYDLICEESYPWYVSSLGYSIQGGYVPKILVSYYDPDIFDYDAYEVVVDNILDEEIIDGMTDVQLALYIHDAIAMIGRYGSADTNTMYTGYGLLVDGAAVCQGYAAAYEDLMNRVGIPCVSVSSREMNHRWNLVKIGDNWYHVDLTWDDNRTQAAGFVRHDNFLLSDEGITGTGHYGWNSVISCTDTRYNSGAFWKVSKSQLCFPDNSVSYQLEGSFADGRIINLTRRDSVTGETTLLQEIEIKFLDTGGWGFYTPCYGLSLWNGTLYYSDMSTVYGVCPVTGKQWTVYEYDYKSTGKLIYSSRVSNDIIYLTLQNSWGDATEITVSLNTTHPHSYTITKATPTCQTGGYSKHSCSCGSSFTTAVSSPSSHSYGSETIIKAPTMESTGLKEAKCIWCGTIQQSQIPMLPVPTFTDVNYGDYYGNAVIWAAKKGITTGTGDDLFSPNMTCTRSQVVTFLWRAMGSPEPSSSRNPFVDVFPKDYYYKAVLWAVEKGITKGVSSTEFAPLAACSRAQVVTFLHRAAGAPVVSGRHNFTDVTKDYYYDAMLWAVQKGITTGTSPTTFSPLTICTRSQIVTFLYRYLG